MRQDINYKSGRLGVCINSNCRYRYIKWLKGYDDFILVEACIEIQNSERQQKNGKTNSALIILTSQHKLGKYFEISSNKTKKNACSEENMVQNASQTAIKSLTHYFNATLLRGR